VATETERDEMVQFVVLLGAGQSVDEPALYAIRNLPGRAHLRRVPVLADRGADRDLGQVIEHDYEGLVAKDPQSLYVGGRTLKWLKVKQRDYHADERG
jgi:hypothetical protein